jgi:hypothetical protein
VDRGDVLTTLGLPADPDALLAEHGQALDAAYREVGGRLAVNTEVSIDDDGKIRVCPGTGPVERLSAEDHQHGHDERPITSRPRRRPILVCERGRRCFTRVVGQRNQPSRDTVRQIVGVVAVVSGRASDDGFSRLLLLRADDGIRTARLVREVIFQVRAGFRDRVRQMIAHGSPPQDRRLQYEPVAGSTDQPIPRDRPAFVPPSRTRPIFGEYYRDPQTAVDFDWPRMRQRPQGRIPLGALPVIIATGKRPSGFLVLPGSWCFLVPGGSLLLPRQYGQAAAWGTVSPAG